MLLGPSESQFGIPCSLMVASAPVNVWMLTARMIWEPSVSIAEPSAVVVTDAPAVAAHYLSRNGRPDVAVHSLSAHGITRDAHEAWVIVQDEHATFENQPTVDQLRARVRPSIEFRIDEALAAQVFRIARR